MVLCGAFNNILGKFDVPYLALPFNILAVLTFTAFHAIHPAAPAELPITTNVTMYYNSSQTVTEDEDSSVEDQINWCMVGRGIAVSMGQVWGINDVTGSTLINLAVLLASPLNFAMSTIGAIVGSLMGVAVLSIDEIPEVYDGIWGYNGVIAMSSVSCVFFAFNHASFTLGLINVFASGLSQVAFRSLLASKV